MLVIHEKRATLKCDPYVTALARAAIGRACVLEMRMRVGIVGFAVSIAMLMVCEGTYVCGQPSSIPLSKVFLLRAVKGDTLIIQTRLLIYLWL